MTVLTYHRVSAQPQTEFNRNVLYPVQKFIKDISWLKRNFDIVPLDTILKNKNHHQRRPQVALTFDDGYRETFKITMDICASENIPITHFITTDTIDGNILPWDALSWVVNKSRRTNTNSTGLGHRSLRNALQRAQFTDELKDYLKKKPISYTLKCIHFLANELQIDLKKINYRNLYILKHELQRETKKYPLLDIGSHTTSHAILSRLTTSESWHQIYVSKKRLTKVLKRNINYFAYPNGRHEDFRTEDSHLIKEAGYAAAFTAVNTPHPTVEKKLSYPRLCIDSGNDLKSMIK